MVMGQRKMLTRLYYYVKLHNVNLHNLERSHMKNPFVYGDVVKGEYFTDREEEIKELVLDLSSGQNSKDIRRA